ncbi:hypothetical protein HDU79_011175 [Rhizoclosmatium sp. JEL0117]|nr:hypothetical protein HDU79_011175 [Rhizoclosmatium sp. JEL0117]
MDDDNYAIQCASESGEIRIVEKLLNIPAVDPSANRGYAIKLSSRHGHTDVVQKLLADPRVDPSVNMDEALRNSAANGHAGVVRLLLADSRVNPGIINNLPIKDAAKAGHHEVVNLLANDPRCDPQAGPRTPLYLASSVGHANVVRVLLGNERVVAPQQDNNEALRKAVQGSHQECVKLLVEDRRIRESLEPDIARTLVSENEQERLTAFAAFQRPVETNLLVDVGHHAADEDDGSDDDTEGELDFDDLLDFIGDVNGLHGEDTE